MQNCPYLIISVGTDIGKTFLVENLCRILPNATAIKPIASGFRDDDKNSDSAKILTSLGLEISQKNLDEISPWRFEEAISPHFAAQNLGTKIDFLQLKNFCEKRILSAKNQNKFLLIEAAGGVMTPLNDEKTFLDLAAELKIPTLLVTANYLGAISHTLTAVEALKSKKIFIEKIIVNENLPLQKKSGQNISTSLQNFSQIETVSLQNFLAQILEKLS